MSANIRLQELQTALNERGIVDKKFFIRSGADTTSASIEEDVIHLMESFLNEEMTDHAPIGDSGSEARNR